MGLRQRQNGCPFPDGILKCIFLDENEWIPIKISLKFDPKGPFNNIPALVPTMAWRRPGDKPLFEPIIVNLLTYIRVTRPQWLNRQAPKHKKPQTVCTFHGMYSIHHLFFLKFVCLWGQEIHSAAQLGLLLERLHPHASERRYNQTAAAYTLAISPFFLSPDVPDFLKKKRLILWASPAFLLFLPDGWVPFSSSLSLLAVKQDRFQVGKYCRIMLASRSFICASSIVPPLITHTRAWKQIFSHCVTVNMFKSSTFKYIP